LTVAMIVSFILPWGISRKINIHLAFKAIPIC
jgi:hypothetical protein